MSLDGIPPRPSFPAAAGPGAAWRVAAAGWILGLLGIASAAEPVLPPVHAPQTGAEYVQAACQSCHLPPDPGLLDRRTWTQEVLRYMTPWLGLSRPNFDRMPDGEILRAARLFPDEPVFSREQWQAVNEHFAAHAPESPPPQGPRPPIRPGLPGFRIETLSWGGQPAFVTLLQVDSERRRLLVGDGQDRSLRAVSHEGTILWRLPVPSGPVAVTRLGPEWLVTLIGRVFPSDEPAGQVWAVREPADPSALPVSRVLLEGLRRPVQTTVTDLDADGLPDLVVSAFGNRLGDLSWYREGTGGRYERRVLEEFPGTLGTVPLDWNGDGRTDLLVLRAQAREGLSVLLNDGDGAFTPVRWVDQSPAFGTVAMERADLDGDGTPEILVVNGDSGDLPAPHKFFHGLRVYGRSPGGEAQERFFFPMHGAYGVRARDFDGDGDLDVALISFFPDFSQPNPEAFVLLENLGGMRFQGWVLPAAESTRGRWLVMDAGDLDGDGDDDLVLGSFFRGPSTTPIPPDRLREWEARPVSVMILRNLRR